MECADSSALFRRRHVAVALAAPSLCILRAADRGPALATSRPSAKSGDKSPHSKILVIRGFLLSTVGLGMNDNEFDLLTTKLLAGEATAEETARLDALLAQDPGRRAEFDELKVAWNALREYGPLTRSLEAPPTPFPEYRLRELQGAVRKHFSTKAREQPESPPFFELLWAGLNARRLLAGAVAAAVLVCGLYFLSRDGGDSPTLAYLVPDQGRPGILRHGKPLDFNTAVSLQKDDQITLAPGDVVHVLTPAGSLPLNGPQRLTADKLNTRVEAGRSGAPRPANRRVATVQTALFGSLKQLLATPMLAVMRDTQGIALYSPRDATLDLTPLILWKAEPGKTYDVTITDEFDNRTPPWEVRGVVPPVDFGNVAAWKGRPLTNNGLYRIIIRETGNQLSAGEYTFRTRKEADGGSATNPAEKIAHAYQLLTSESPCPGDALAELMTLPTEFAESELVLRLELALFGQLGLQEDYDATVAKLKPPSNTQPRQ